MSLLLEHSGHVKNLSADVVPALGGHLDIDGDGKITKKEFIRHASAEYSSPAVLPIPAASLRSHASGRSLTARALFPARCAGGRTAPQICPALRRQGPEGGSGEGG